MQMQETLYCRLYFIWFTPIAVDIYVFPSCTHLFDTPDSQRVFLFNRYIRAETRFDAVKDNIISFIPIQIIFNYFSTFYAFNYISNQFTKAAVGVAEL